MDAVLEAGADDLKDDGERVGDPLGASMRIRPSSRP